MRIRLISFISAISFINTIIFVIYGLIQRSHFHNGSECEMTYSLYQFFHIPIISSANIDNNHDVISSYPYRLMKFTDRRDPRYTYLNQNDINLNRAVDWCNPHPPSKRGHIVLYVPGHHGNYEQARSLGAHGNHFTGRSLSSTAQQSIVDDLKSGIFNGKATDLSKFTYDVYSLDFLTEDTGIHASYIYSQAYFISECVQYLAKSCRVDIQDITIVAHSLGALAVRKSLILLNKQLLRKAENDGHSHIPLSDKVKTVITLGSPMSASPFTFDDSIYHFYKTLSLEEKQLNEQELGNDTLILSISGGLRDELIPPSLCSLHDIREGSPPTQSNHRHLAFLASDIMPQGKSDDNPKNVPMFGMDHNAIVWCHNILQIVRKLIHISAISSISQRELVDLVPSFISHHTDASISLFDFGTRVLSQDDLLESHYGFIKSLAIQSTMLYNAQLLVSHYILIIMFHGLFLVYTRKTSTSEYIKLNHTSLYYACAPFLFTILASRMFHYQRLWKVLSTYIISTIAMNIYYGILYIILPCARWITKKIHNIKPTSTKKMKIYEKNVSVKRMILIQLNWFLGVLILYSFLIVLMILRQSKESIDDGFLWNKTSLASHSYILSTLFVYTNVLYLGIQPILPIQEKVYSSQTKISHVFISLAIPLFLLVNFGKIHFALSILTKKAQLKSLIYMETMWGESMLGNDFLKGFLFIHLPFYLMALCIHFQMYHRRYTFMVNNHADLYPTTKDN